MALAAGTRLGPYEILAPLGAGGMGEVYRARDTRLKRDVAVKVLPAELASEPERLGRFQREAETLAALNHPHIVTIFSVEEAHEYRFLTMELVEGKTLSKVIPRGGLPLSRLFQIAIPLAEAVSAAHEKGIVHRDLKPGNVMVTEEDRVKVLDFGLAKLREGVRGTVDTQSPTEPATGPGRILGTAPYMSPEQVQGKTLDHRSDVFALGIMLYEMTTGERPFAGDTFADVASSILKDTPASVTERKAELPRDLGKLIRHCLEKEPRKRFQSTLDLANELDDLRREVDTGEALTSGGAPVATSRAGGKRRMWLVGGAVVVALALAVGSLLSSRAAAPPAAPLEIKPFTSDGEWKTGPQLSPDGEKVAYQWRGDLYVKGVGVGTRPLRLTEDSAFAWGRPVWSPDGRQIAFVRHLDENPAIYTMPWPGGQERRLIQLTGPAMEWGSYTTLSWSPDGEWLAFAEKPSEDEPSRIVRLALASLEKEPLTSPPKGSQGDFHPSYSPDGSQLAFVRASGSRAFGRRDVWVQSLQGGEARRVTFEGYEWCWVSAWTTDGREVLFTVSKPYRLLRVSLAGGDPQPIPGVGAGAKDASVREDRMVYVQTSYPPEDIWRLPGRGAALPDPSPTKLIGSSGEDFHPSYSPDGQRIAFTSDRSGTTNIWVCDSDGSNPVQLTNLDRHTGAARWSPDGRRLVFDSHDVGGANLYVIDADGGVPRQLTQEPSADNTGAWSPDGKWIYFHSDRSGGGQIWKMPAEGGQAVQVTRDGCGAHPEVSWDGRAVYCREDSVIWSVPVDAPERAEAILEHDDLAQWALGGSGIYFALKGDEWGYTIRYHDFESGQVTDLHRLERGSGVAVSPDEQWILYSASSGGHAVCDLMLVENFR